MSLADDITAIRADTAETKTAVALLVQEAKDVKEWRGKLDVFIDGNGKDGLKVRVDRLEQGDARRKWLLRVIVIAIAAQLATIIFGG